MVLVALVTFDVCTTDLVVVVFTTVLAVVVPAVLTVVGLSAIF